MMNRIHVLCKATFESLRSSLQLVYMMGDTGRLTSMTRTKIGRFIVGLKSLGR